MDNISVVTAFVAGLSSFLLPCVLPLAPIYMAILAGPEILSPGAKKNNARIFIHSLIFVAGFSAVFVGLGAGAGLAGLAININFIILKQVAGILLIVFGALFLLSQKVPQLNFQKRLSPGQSSKTGYIRSFTTGAIFSMASMTCATYILGGILTLAAASATAWQGASLLAVYSLGLGIPFLIIGAAFEKVTPLLRRIQRHSRAVYITSGAVLIVLGILVTTGKINLLGTVI